MMDQNIQRNAKSTCRNTNVCLKNLSLCFQDPNSREGVVTIIEDKTKTSRALRALSLCSSSADFGLCKDVFITATWT